MTRGGNHYARLHFVADPASWIAMCGRSGSTLRCVFSRDEWDDKAARAAGDLCAACRANVRKLEVSHEVR